ncbi:hypothetical protein BDW72DRAFT_35315 [Aspergillus terricola var. indicus]
MNQSPSPSSKKENGGFLVEERTTRSKRSRVGDFVWQVKVRVRVKGVSLEFSLYHDLAHHPSSSTHQPSIPLGITRRSGRAKQEEAMLIAASAVIHDTDNGGLSIEHLPLPMDSPLSFPSSILGNLVELLFSSTQPRVPRIIVPTRLIWTP